MNKTVALETLGCKVNQYESSHMLEMLGHAGYANVSFRQPADVFIVHSCAVTAKASFQTRQLLRRARRLRPDAMVVVAGCAAQFEPRRFAEETLATHILGSSEKFDLLKWLETPATIEQPCCAVAETRPNGPFRIIPVHHMAAARTRAFLKVQDGCDAFCSYCIVPFSRGKSRSLPLDEVRTQYLRFQEVGYPEIVLSGIHLGQWGKDLQPALRLVKLIDSLHEGTRPPRLRLSSLETMEWQDGLLEGLPHWQGICPHFHVPLQSGDAEILRRMHRPYSPKDFAEVILELHRQSPNAALGSDVLVGFPGETSAHFRNTLEFIEKMPLTYLHVFPYSPRPGTEAARWPGRITGTELKRRTQALRDLSRTKKLSFHFQFLNATVEVLVEDRLKDRNGWYQGTTDNYLKVQFSTHQSLIPGARIWVKVREVSDTGLIGTWAGTAAMLC
ncbi:MAG TPA: tRNA (N(6)-L-threonylcarbamoyladenosine(37)-C(2))-methylthiotransferase MtaB [Syntrophobacteraceae bacterium]|nr:tRNA (N(6)-L-threonylcarbamoyladenosine(37)-C(2))-methylthiotransferase MtaB [Syntrophobacteraceae bacterium]